MKNKLGVSLLVIVISALSASAEMIITLVEQGNDLVATASGSFNTTDLTLDSSTSGPYIAPVSGVLHLGGDGSYATRDTFSSISGPSNFGTGSGGPASSSSGDFVALRITTENVIMAPDGYVSGTFLSGTSTWSNMSLANQGITPGSYVWTWGSGENADSLTLNAIPEPATFAFIGISAIAAFTGRRIFRM